MTNYLVAGLGFGDEGKGSIVDYLCSGHFPDRGRLVVRFNGGAQAAHNVVTGEGRHHTFAQFGSGTLQGARTHLSRFMLLNPLNMMREAAHLQELGIADPWGLVTADPGAMVITPYHVLACRQREENRSPGRHGSCGEGIWETVLLGLTHPSTTLRAGDLTDRGRTYGKLISIAAALSGKGGTPFSAPLPSEIAAEYQKLAALIAIRPDPEVLGPALKEGGVVFEGAQGILLDPHYGCDPYVTGTDTTFANAEALIHEAGGASAVRIGVTRTYMTRHGPGPFPTEDKALSIPEPHNRENPWQGPVRCGYLDVKALRYALRSCNGVDMIALTHMDTLVRHQGLARICLDYGPADGGGDFWADAGHANYSYCDVTLGGFPASLAYHAGCPVGILSYGPDAACKVSGPSGLATAAIKEEVAL
jgi:adenylosuccinate synthase